MAVSRILSADFSTVMIIYLNPAFAGPPNALARIMMRRYPRINPEFLRGGSDRLSSLCFVLHRVGFFVPRELLRER